MKSFNPGIWFAFQIVCIFNFFHHCFMVFSVQPCLSLRLSILSVLDNSKWDYLLNFLFRRFVVWRLEMQLIFQSWFCVLQFHWICWVLVFLSDSLGFSFFKIMSFENRDNFTSSFMSWMLFTSISCIIALARTSTIMLNRSGESQHSCLIPELGRKAFGFTPLSKKFAVSFWFMIFIMLRLFPSIPNLLRAFIMKWCCILLNGFSASLGITIWFLSFTLLMFHITLIDFHMLNHSHIQGINLTWSWYVSFNVLLDSVC